MTITSGVNDGITYSGNGSTTNFPFPFKVNTAAQVEVIIRDPDGVETIKTLNSHYTVANQNVEGSGSVTYPASGSALASGYKITINPKMDFKQSTDIRNQGRFAPETHEAAFDTAMMHIKELRGMINRAALFKKSSGITGFTFSDDPVAGKLLYVANDGLSIKMSGVSYGDIQGNLSTLVAIAADISAVAAIDTDVSAVAAIDTDVSAVAAITAEVQTVAGIDSEVATVAGISSAVSTVSGIAAAVSNVSSISSAVSNVSSISSAVSTVSGISANVTTVAGISANVTTVAGISSAVSTVASISSAVSSVNSNASNINTVAGISSSVSTVAGISANVTTVAGISANVTTVAGLSSSIASIIANLTSIQNAASFGFPTLASGDEYKTLQIKADRSGYNAVEAISRRNAIINGAFDIWQENSSFASAADGTYTADMWVYGKQGAMVHDISRSTDVPTVAQAGRLFNYSALIDCQTVDSSIGSTDICAFEQKIEGYNWLPLAQKALVLSFWVKATKTGTYCVSLRNNRSGTPDRSYVAEYTVSQSDTWEFKTVTFSASPSAGTWNYTNGNGCSLSFCLAGGSSFQTTAGAWQTGNYLCTSNQVNACDSTSNNFRVTAVQLEIGSLPTPFEGRTFQEERRLCQRYWESSYEYGSAPGTSSSNGKFSYSVSSSGGFVATVPFKVVKRTTSSNTFYSITGASGNLRNETSSADVAASPAMSSETGVGIDKGGLTSGHSISGHFVANARL